MALLYRNTGLYNGWTVTVEDTDTGYLVSLRRPNGTTYVACETSDSIFAAREARANYCRYGETLTDKDAN